MRCEHAIASRDDQRYQAAHPAIPSNRRTKFQINYCRVNVRHGKLAKVLLVQLLFHPEEKIFGGRRREGDAFNRTMGGDEVIWKPPIRRGQI